MLYLTYEQKPVGANYVESYLLTYIVMRVWNVYLYVLCLLWQHPAKSLPWLLFYGHPLESPVDRQAYLLISLPSCFTAADFTAPHRDGPQFSRWLPKKKHCCFFSPVFVTQRERPGHKSTWGEAVVFCPGRPGFIALHEKLIGGLFCVRVNFTADCVYWSSRKTK